MNSKSEDFGIVLKFCASLGTSRSRINRKFSISAGEILSTSVTIKLVWLIKNKTSTSYLSFYQPALKRVRKNKNFIFDKYLDLLSLLYALLYCLYFE